MIDDIAFICHINIRNSSVLVAFLQSLSFFKPAVFPGMQAHLVKINCGYLRYLIQN